MMIKKTSIAALAVLALVLLCFVGAGAANDYTVSTADELKDACSNANSAEDKIILAADIYNVTDNSKSGDEIVGLTFASGVKLDSNGHTIQNNGTLTVNTLD